MDDVDRLEAFHVTDDRIQQTSSLAQSGLTFFGRPALSKQTFENDARVSFRWKRRGWRGPGQIILVDARIAIVALANHLK